MAVLAAQLESSESDRRDDNRITASLPMLLSPQGHIRLIDFSDSGFRAHATDSLRAPGASGRATLVINACGYAVRKEITFEVVRIVGDTVGARYETLSTTTEHTGCGF